MIFTHTCKSQLYFVEIIEIAFILWKNCVDNAVGAAVSSWKAFASKLTNNRHTTWHYNTKEPWGWGPIVVPVDFLFPPIDWRWWKIRSYRRKLTDWLVKAPYGVLFCQHQKPKLLSGSGGGSQSKRQQWAKMVVIATVPHFGKVFKRQQKETSVMTCQKESVCWDSAPLVCVILVMKFALENLNRWFGC